MTKTRDNHYVPQWYQKGFMDERENQLCHLTRREITQPGRELKIVHTTKWHTSAQRFYEVDLYSILFGAEVNDEIERKLFGPIDDNGSKSVRAFLTDEQSQWHHNFEDFFTYLDAQKIRTPKGLDWVKSKYSELTQLQLMIEMQSLRTMHSTLWTEGVRELVSAEDSDVKFITSDHPVTIYNYACSPNSELCSYPNDPDVSLKGSQTIFPLNKNRCLILTNLEYASDPENTNPLEQRTNPTRMRHSMVSTINFINTRKLTAIEVSQINYIIKNRAKASIASGREEWLHPEKTINCDWADLREVLLPPSNKLHEFGGEMFAKFEDGTVHYQDAFGRTTRPNEFLEKNIDESRIGRNELCGCGSGRKYKVCCRLIPADLRTSWNISSIRERNLAFCNCIKTVLGLNSGKTWLDVRRELSEDQIREIYGFYAAIWPRETDIYSLLPKSDGKFRGLYSGQLDVRTIYLSALPMASIFDEFLIQMPIVNPNNVRPEFSPIESPGKYKYQSLKDFMFMLQMEPFIGLGIVNLIPDPCEFDIELMRAMMEMARGRGSKDKIICKKDLELHFRLTTEDLLNSTAMMPRDVRIQFLIKELGLDKTNAENFINELDKNSESSSLMMLQKSTEGNHGQLMLSRISPNYEMALFIAQVTGSNLVTDSGSRWKDFMSAQYRNQGIATYPWSEIFDNFSLMPIDEQMLDTFRKSQGQFSTLRNLLKKTDRMVSGNNTTQLALIAAQAFDLTEHLGQMTVPLILKKLEISSPEGGFSDANVQRLLARSSCLRYDRQVRAVYGVDI